MENSKWFPEIHGNFGFGCMRLPMKGGQVDYDEFSRMALRRDSIILIRHTDISEDSQKRQSEIVFRRDMIVHRFCLQIS